MLNTVLKCILLKNLMCPFAFFCPADGIVLLDCYLCLNSVVLSVRIASGTKIPDSREFFSLCFSRSGCRESKESWSNPRPSVNFKKFSS